MFASMFPNLLDLEKSSNDISEEVICQILKRCCKIRPLNLTYCNEVKLLRRNFQVPKLKVLYLLYASVDDHTLCMVSKRCFRLLQHDL